MCSPVGLTDATTFRILLPLFSAQGSEHAVGETD
jgi:hypothetical protein